MKKNSINMEELKAKARDLVSEMYEDDIEEWYIIHERDIDEILNKKDGVGIISEYYVGEDSEGDFTSAIIWFASYPLEEGYFLVSWRNRDVEFISSIIKINDEDIMSACEEEEGADILSEWLYEISGNYIHENDIEEIITNLEGYEYIQEIFKEILSDMQGGYQNRFFEYFVQAGEFYETDATTFLSDVLKKEDIIGL